MYNTALRIVGDEDDAHDVLQEAFISAFKNLSTYRADASFGAWLKRIVINNAINRTKTKRMERMPDDEELSDKADEEPSEDRYENLTVERVKRSIELLPNGYRAVLSLYLLEGYDHQEIAAILNITTSTSKSQLNRAKSKLREVLTELKWVIR